MVNNRIIYLLGLLLIITFFVCILGYFYHKNKLLEVEKNILKSTIQLQAEETVKKTELKIDSLTNEIVKKQKTIINNTFIYEQKNKNIGRLDSNATDSLYRSSLRANYIKYGHLIQ
jgi:lipopolysaccharide export LptBFGC system permease protein LptF